MSKVTYLLGAGASFGTRNDKKNPPNIVRGLPIISEIPVAIDQLLLKLGYDPHIKSDDPLREELLWLKEKCIEYPTIDTYAKILYVTGDGINKEYLHLKRVLSLFFLLFQDKSTRDLRYDNFVASIIGANKELPPIDILTWNYDAQLEFAMSEYFRYESIEDLWRYRLGAFIKTFFHTYFGAENSFSITKLNGTAFFAKNNNRGETHVMDMLLGNMSSEEKINEANDILKAAYNINDLKLPQSGISYAWETGVDNEILPQIEKQISNTEVLVVIGYSFPYVNRAIDKRLLASMKNLKKVYIQDPRSRQIADILSTLCPITHDDMVFPDYNNQFIIPYELELTK